MKALENQTYLIAYIISNVLAIVMLVLAWKWPRLSRLLFAILFAGASVVNWNLALTAPREYLGYADLTSFGIYRDFIKGWFSHHILFMVGFIATAQGVIAISLLLKGWIYKLGLTGAILFFLSIAPLGVGSAFPCTLITAFAMVLLWKQNAFMWQYKRPKYLITVE